MAPRLLLSTAAAGLSALALRVAAPSPAASLRELSSLEPAVDVSQPLVAAAALLAWALLAHLALVGLLTLATALPGRCGAAGDAVLRRCAPAGLRRAVALSLGVGLLVGTGAGAASAAPAPSASLSAVSLDWPAAAGAPASLDWPAPVDGPGTPAPSAAPATPAVLIAPAAPVTTPALVADPELVRAPTPDEVVQVAGPAAPQPTADVTVTAGDSLWSLARAALPSDATAQEVAQAWPSWWAANRAVIGDDPDLIHPGQSLRAPR
jgi:hypothetical protein